MAIREGRTQPGLQQHLFIMQWLTTAKKQKRFPKSVAEDIEWLIQQGKRYGFGANLYQKVEYIYRSSIGELAKQSPLFRFTYFIETLKISGWLDFLLSAKDWHEYYRASDTACAVYTPKTELHQSFSDNGQMTAPLEIRFTGDTSGVAPLLEQCNLSVNWLPDEQGFSVLIILPQA
uniref:DUF2913 family protein n=1 Tax=Salmonella enterica TaxID=28901 RepID=UPI003A8F6FFA